MEIKGAKLFGQCLADVPAEQFMSRPAVEENGLDMPVRIEKS